MIAPQSTTTDPVWHIAVDGAAQGPFGRSDLGRMMNEGRFTRDTLVWAPGQDGWLPADEVPALAQLFTMLPPPLPQTPPKPPAA